MALSIVDTQTPEEIKALKYYQFFPGTTWVDAAERLGISENDACNISMRLALLGHLRRQCNEAGLSCFFPSMSRGQ